MSDEFIYIISDSLLDTFIIDLETLVPCVSEEQIIDVENKEANSGNLAKQDRSKTKTEDGFYEHLNKYQSDIGEMGELFIIEREKEKLKNTDYFDKIQHVSKTDSSAGYDIISYDTVGTELYIEVKSTESNYDCFYITQNELDVASSLKAQGKKYLIFRVINIFSQPSYFTIEDITKDYTIEPIVWKAKKDI